MIDMGPGTPERHIWKPIKKREKQSVDQNPSLFIYFIVLAAIAQSLHLGHSFVFFFWFVLHIR